MPISKETRNKLSQAQKKLWRNPLIRKSRIDGISMSWKNAERRNRTIASLKKTWNTPAGKATKSAATKKTWENPETRMKRTVATGISNKNPVVLEKISRGVAENYQNPAYKAFWMKQTHSTEQRTSRRKKIKQWWVDVDESTKNKIIGNIVRGSRIRPTALEKKLTELLDGWFPNQWFYVGNGRKIVGGKNPDFVHATQRKLIEVYGRHWHKESEQQERIAHFGKWGYDAMVIWEEELKDPNLVNILTEFTIR